MEFLLPVCFFFVNHLHAQNKIVETNTTLTLHYAENILGHNIFNALKENKAANWISLYPTNEEYSAILQVMLAAKVDGLTQVQIDTMFHRRKTEAAAAFTDQFNKFCAQADSLGIVWKNAVYEKFEFIAAYPEKVKVKYLTGDVRFKCGNHHFLLEDIEALETEKGYRLQSIKGIKRVDD